MADLVRQFARSWDQFWFGTYRPKQLFLFRLCFGLVLFLSTLSRTSDVETFYSDRGLVPLASVSQIIPTQYHLSLLTYFSSDTAIWVFHWALVASILLMMFGMLPRLAAAAAFVIHLSFMHRNPATVYGVDKIGVFFLFYLAFTKIPRWKDLASNKVFATPILSSVALRLIQIQLCVIYGYSGLTKLKGMHWWLGDALWEVLSNNQIARFNFSWTAQFPTILALLSYMTVLFEVYFPFLIWTKIRVPFLIFGVLMHLGIGFSVNLPIFSALMIVTYVLFLEDRELEWLLKLRLPRKPQAQTPGLREITQV